jgi:hypothetical protein
MSSNNPNNKNKNNSENKKSNNYTPNNYLKNYIPKKNYTPKDYTPDVIESPIFKPFQLRDEIIYLCMDFKLRRSSRLFLAYKRRVFSLLFEEEKDEQLISEFLDAYYQEFLDEIYKFAEIQDCSDGEVRKRDETNWLSDLPKKFSDTF